MDTKEESPQNPENGKEWKENTFVKPAPIAKPKPIETLPLTPHEYLKKPSIIDTLKLPQLRETLKHYKKNISFQITTSYTHDLEHYGTTDVRKMKQNIKALYNFTLLGTKPRLQERVRSFFQMWTAALRIQRRFRGNMIRYSQKLRGPALLNRKICINETDFYTLEPLNEIRVLDFFSYQTKDGFIYGFDINSIRAQMKVSHKKLNNPYTRESMMDILPNIRKLGRISRILTNIHSPHAATEPPPLAESPPSRSSSRTTNAIIRNGVPSLATLIERSIPRQSISFRPNISLYLPADYNIEDTVNRLREIRSKSILERANALFMEIDQLGHYTQAEWFLQLCHRDTIRFYRNLHELWHYRAGLSFSVKVYICPLWDPFIMQMAEQSMNQQNDEEVIKTMCLNVMEEMIYTGINQDYKMLGAFHMLSALTLISIPARNSMMWLYESLR